MIIDAGMKVPAAPTAELREAILAHWPKARARNCPQCGVNRLQVLDALCDPECWENRALAVSLILSCRSSCRETIREILADALHSSAGTNDTDACALEQAM